MPPEQSTSSPGIKWNEVTWYSKLGAIILFVGVVPALCFYIGTQYEAAVSTQTQHQAPSIPAPSIQTISYSYSEHAPPDETWDYTLTLNQDNTGTLSIDGFQTQTNVSVTQKANTRGSIDVLFAGYNGTNMYKTFSKGDRLFTLIPGSIGGGFTVRWDKLQPQISQDKTNAIFSQVITSDEALAMVNNLPDVKAYVQRVTAAHGQPHVAVSNQPNLDDPQNPYWSVQVYENLSDHNSTYAWYSVYIKSNEIYKDGEPLQTTNSTTSYTPSQLIGSWSESLANGDSAEMVFAVTTGKNVYNSYLHNRPAALNCTWSLTAVDDFITVLCPEQGHISDMFQILSLNANTLTITRGQPSDAEVFQRVK